MGSFFGWENWATFNHNYSKGQICGFNGLIGRFYDLDMGVRYHFRHVKNWSEDPERRTKVKLTLSTGSNLCGKNAQYIIVDAQKCKIPSAMASYDISITWTWGSDSTFDHLKFGHTHV